MKMGQISTDRDGFCCRRSLVQLESRVHTFHRYNYPISTERVWATNSFSMIRLFMPPLAPFGINYFVPFCFCLCRFALVELAKLALHLIAATNEKQIFSLAMRLLATHGCSFTFYELQHYHAGRHACSTKLFLVFCKSYQISHVFILFSYPFRPTSQQYANYQRTKIPMEFFIHTTAVTRIFISRT